MKAERRELSILRGDASITVIDKANAALDLFTQSRDIPLQDETTTTTEPPRSTKTTTVARRTSTTTRAIALTTLAADNLAFFQENSLSSQEGAKKAEQAVNNLFRYLERNKHGFIETSQESRAFLEGELERTKGELAALKRSLRGAEMAEERASIEGRINISNLRIQDIKGLSRDNDRISAFFERLGSQGRK